MGTLPGQTGGVYHFWAPFISNRQTTLTALWKGRSAVATCSMAVRPWMVAPGQPGQWEGHTPSPDTSKSDDKPILDGPQPLNGCIVLVVEDEFLIADDIAALLREAGAEVVGPAASLPEGMRLAGETQRIDAAVLNIDLGGVTVFPLADQLLTRGVRFMFLTGYGDGNIPADYAAIPCCKKPTGPACVIEELKALLRPLAA